MFTISGIHVIHIHELKKVMATKPPSLWAFQVVQISQLSTMTNWISFCYTPSQQASRDCIAWQLMNTLPMSTTAYVHQKRRHTQRWRFKSLFRSFAVDPILFGMQIYLHKTYFFTHQSVTDITAAIGTPWLHKLWLGLVLSTACTGRSSITTFVLTSVDWWLCLWPSANLQPNFGFKMKLSCRGHDHALPFAYDLFRVTYLIWNQACTCVRMHTEDRKHLWLFIVACLRWRHDFPSTIFCIHSVHDKLYCSMNNYRWKCRHFRNVLYHSMKVNWSS